MLDLYYVLIVTMLIDLSFISHIELVCGLSLLKCCLFSIVILIDVRVILCRLSVFGIVGDAILIFVSIFYELAIIISTLFASSQIQSMHHLTLDASSPALFPDSPSCPLLLQSFSQKLQRPKEYFHIW